LGTHGFVLSGGIFTAVDDPSATGVTVAFGLNDSGQIVGVYDAQGAEFGFVATSAPEPATAVILPTGLLGLAAIYRLKRRAVHRSITKLK